MILGLTLFGILVIILVSFAICTTVCSLSMEAAVLFTPSFLVLFPAIVQGFPHLPVNASIGLSLVVEIFGYSSSVAGYWYRKRIDFHVAGRLILMTAPLAVVGRIASYIVPGSLLIAAFGVLLLSLALIVLMNHARIAELNANPSSYRAKTCLFCALQPWKGHGDPPDGAGYHTAFKPDGKDKGTLSVAGLFAGLAGIAVGEIVQTFLILKKCVPLKFSGGTSALTLHLTILTALLMNVAILFIQPPFLPTKGIAIPWNIALIIAPTVLLGGQVGSWVNSRLSPTVQVRSLVVVYGLVGVVALGLALF